MKYVIFAVYTHNILGRISQKFTTMDFSRKGNWSVWEPRFNVGLFFKMPLYLLNIKPSEFTYKRRGVFFVLLKYAPEFSSSQVNLGCFPDWKKSEAQWMHGPRD